MKLKFIYVFKLVVEVLYSFVDFVVWWYGAGLAKTWRWGLTIIKPRFALAFTEIKYSWPSVYGLGNYSWLYKGLKRGGFLFKFIIKYLWASLVTIEISLGWLIWLIILPFSIFMLIR